MSPNARRVANEEGLSLDGIKGTGPNGRIITQNLSQAGEQQPEQPPPPEPEAPAPPPPESTQPAPPPQPVQTGENPYVDIDLTGMRKTIASRLLESKQTIPHYYMTVSV